MTQPRTAAGRGFIEQYAHASPGDAYRRTVAAIETEAREAALDEVRREVEADLMDDVCSPYFLAILDCLREPRPNER